MQEGWKMRGHFCNCYFVCFELHSRL
uniref:Uncharacterized protein n=1 Tax=Rhizophora mucronata TaxID=61149 RepID=A0A2P2R553_RHIMU